MTLVPRRLSHQKNKKYSSINRRPITRSQTKMASFTNEQFTQLLETIKTMGIAQQATPVIINTTGSFAKCSSRYDGKSNVEIFIADIDTYKETANVPDDIALRGFRILLTGDAALWWDGIKSSVHSYNDAKNMLQAAFGDQRPKYMVFQEIYNLKQGGDMRTDLFIAKVRVLFAKLNVMEETQLDMIYGQLSRKIRERVKRTDFETYGKLLELARAEELFLNEVKVATNMNGIKIKSNSESDSSRTVRCNYCRNVGHTKENCLRLSKPKSTSSEKAPSPEIKCYGCGTPGVVRTNCPKCKQKSATSASSISFSSLDTGANKLQSRDRPILNVAILDNNGIGLLDTASRACIASVSLVKILRENGLPFTEMRVDVRLADGSCQQGKRVFCTKCDVSIPIGVKTVPTTFIVFPDDDVQNTILGIDFIMDAGIVIDSGKKLFWFNNNPNKSHPLKFETYQQPISVDFATIELRPDEGVELSTEEKIRVESLLTSFSDNFEPGGDPTDYIEHCIKTIDANQLPVAVPPYQMSGPRKAILKQEIDKMLDGDVIEECESPWAAPVVMIPKKNNEVRVCVDYRRLNSVTVTDCYPLPRIDELLHLAKQSLFMSTIDLRSGYWQVKVSNEDRDKTAFITPFGLYRFKRMPFGLKNAPATFQRLIDRFRAGLLNVTILAYLDDIIVISNSFDQHLRDLEMIFKRLQLFNLRANREKCHFFRRNVQFLGHVITNDGIKTDPNKVSAILKMSPPVNVSQIRTFLQTCSWYRKFINNFSEVARPLTNLTKKNAPWIWSEAESSAFESLKRLLTEAPILRQMDPEQPFILMTDASCYALGAVLVQGEGYDERPIEYASRLLIAAERNYSTTEREALAVVWALNKFRGYIEGAEIVVRTDHQPLKWLLTTKSPIGRLARWVMLIQSFNLTIIYTAGKSNVVADTLSRPPITIDSETIVESSAFEIDFPQRGPTDLRRLQLEDEEVSKIIHSIENYDDPNHENYVSRGYLMEQGVLYRYNDEEIEEAQLVVPTSLRNHILMRYHSDPTAGHYGIDRTLSKIGAKYFWPGMRRSITEFCRRCEDCQKYKVSNLKPNGLLKTPIMAQRMEVMAVDLFGPLPEADNGYRHILIVEDVATRWVELFPLVFATALDCTKTLIDEVFLRYGLPRRLISDNGSQFISEIVQHTTYCFGIEQSLTPLYHPQANPVERRNRDLKTQLGILVGELHTKWPKYLPSIRFAMNTTKCEATDRTPAFLTFGRELRTLEDVTNDVREIIQSENFVPQISPYLWKLQGVIKDARELNEREQDRRKECADTRRQHRPFKIGDLVLVTSHVQSNATKGFSRKLAPRRDGPYRICKVINSTTYEVETADRDKTLIGKYHVSALKLYSGDNHAVPTNPIRRRGRPRQP